MTEMLDVAVAKLALLPPQEQDRIAQWLLREISDEHLWESQFAASPDVLNNLVAEAHRDLLAGKTTELNPDNL